MDNWVGASGVDRRADTERTPSSGLDRLRAGDCVAVALSGGVDSAVAARLLQERGCRVLAFHMVLTPENSSMSAAQDAARTLGLDLVTADLTAEFDRLVVEPFVRSYARGHTPNPCVVCNPLVKFDLLWQRARLLGATYLATGHYAALIDPLDGSGLRLVRPRDRRKDQTYFLCRLSREAINRAVFPLADMSKPQTREWAARLALSPRPESQDICFLAGGDYRSLVRERLGDAVSRPGDFVDVHGRPMGRHRGLMEYTIGQRRGLNTPGPEPYYVLALDPAANRVVLGTKAQTRSRRFTVRDTVWNSEPPGADSDVLVQIRSRHVPAPARVHILPGGRTEVEFHQPQESITVGQAAAFYVEDVLLGGGWIDRVFISDTPQP